MIPGMKLHLRRKWVLAAAPFVFAIGLALAGCGDSNYQDGTTRATQELKNGNPCIYTTSMADVGHTDPKTGLPYLVLEEPETPELLRMIEGHNATMYAKYAK